MGTGQCRPEIVEAISQQAKTLDFFAPFQAGNRPSK
jgi:adenosylmethionine-8-amino-7-oxononanoate aminotransferase